MLNANELKAMEELAESFADKELAGKAGERDRYPFGDFFSDVVEKAYRAGFMGVMLPADMGGANGGIGALCTVLKSLSREDASLAGIVFTIALVQELLTQANAEAVMREIFAQASSARDVVVAFPSYLDPSQADGLPLAAGTEGNYALSGKLELLVLGSLAARAVVPARFPDEAGFSFFLIDLPDQPDLMDQALSKSSPVVTLGLHACPAVDLRMDNAKARLIGERGKGGLYFERTAGKMYAAAGAMNAGIMRGSFREALGYARERFQGGRAIAKWSEVGMVLADMAMKTEAVQLCLEQACRLLESEREDNGRQCLAVALQIHELACAVVTEGVQILGGYGYMKDYGQEKRYRDARQVQALLGSTPLRKLDLINRY